MIKKRGIYKICKSMIAVLCAIIMVTVSTVRIKAATIGKAISTCITDCGVVLGAAGLSVYWDYNDGEYVGPEDYSMLYVPKDNNGSVCSFSNFETNDYSNGWSYVRCDYYTWKDGCYVYGELYVSCDTYGEFDNWGRITESFCAYSIDN